VYYFNSSLNIGKGNLTIYGIEPDQNGEIHMSLTRGSTESPGGYLNAIILTGYMSPAYSEPQPPAQAESMIFVEALKPVETVDEIETSDATVTEELASSKFSVNAHPNPFTSKFLVSIETAKDDIARVTVYGMNGQMLYFKEARVSAHGKNNIDIENIKGLQASGIFIVKIDLLKQRQSKMIKLVKQ
jgi:hypothetical protein